MILDHQCGTCRHYQRGHCAAFPEGIPGPILALEADHRQPYPGDGGIRWEPADGESEQATVFLNPDDDLLR